MIRAHVFCRGIGEGKALPHSQSIEDEGVGGAAAHAICAPLKNVEACR